MLELIDRAYDGCLGGEFGAMVTAPVSKAVINDAGIAFTGHTEFLAELAKRDGIVPQPVMMLWCPALAVVPVTIHVSLRDAITLALDGPHR